MQPQLKTKNQPGNLTALIIIVTNLPANRTADWRLLPSHVYSERASLEAEKSLTQLHIPKDTIQYDTIRYDTLAGADVIIIDCAAFNCDESAFVCGTEDQKAEIIYVICRYWVKMWSEQHRKLGKTRPQTLWRISHEIPSFKTQRKLLYEYTS